MDSAAIVTLRERIQSLEACADVTKTSLKMAIMQDKSLDWPALRKVALLAPHFRPQSWKSDLINSLLSRTYPHGGPRQRVGTELPIGLLLWEREASCR